MRCMVEVLCWKRSAIRRIELFDATCIEKDTQLLIRRNMAQAAECGLALQKIANVRKAWLRNTKAVFDAVWVLVKKVLQPFCAP